MEGDTAQRSLQVRHGLPVLFTGLSGAGKSTLARAVHQRLRGLAIDAELLDADQVRSQLSGGLGFSRADREENLRRIAFVAGLLTKHRVVALVAAVSPYRGSREAMRGQLTGLLEVFVDAPICICERRDPVGLYRRFRAGEVRQLSGLDDPYEAPHHPEVHCCTAKETIDESAVKVTEAILFRLRRRAAL